MNEQEENDEALFWKPGNYSNNFYGAWTDWIYRIFHMES